jgi:hypothetical protein
MADDAYTPEALIEMNKTLVTMLVGSGNLTLGQARLLAEQTPKAIRHARYSAEHRELAAHFVEYVYSNLPWKTWEAILSPAPTGARHDN